MNDRQVKLIEAIRQHMPMLGKAVSELIAERNELARKCSLVDNIPLGWTLLHSDDDEWRFYCNRIGGGLTIAPTWDGALVPWEAPDAED